MPKNLTAYRVLVYSYIFKINVMLLPCLHSITIMSSVTQMDLSATVLLCMSYCEVLLLYPIRVSACFFSELNCPLFFVILYTGALFKASVFPFQSYLNTYMYM